MGLLASCCLCYVHDMFPPKSALTILGFTVVGQVLLSQLTSALTVCPFGAD